MRFCAYIQNRELRSKDRNKAQIRESEGLAMNTPYESKKIEFNIVLNYFSGYLIFFKFIAAKYCWDGDNSIIYVVLSALQYLVALESWMIEVDGKFAAFSKHGLVKVFLSILDFVQQWESGLRIFIIFASNLGIFAIFDSFNGVWK